MKRHSYRVFLAALALSGRALAQDPQPPEAPTEPLVPGAPRDRATPPEPPAAALAIPGGRPQPGRAADDGYPLAGYHGGIFYLRSADDVFRLYVGGRLQVDMYNYFGPGVSDTTLKSTLFLRRVRPELSGEFMKNWQFFIAGDFASANNVDNANGTNETQAAKPGVAPMAATARYASAQTASIRANATDAFVLYHPVRVLNFQLGQFDAPFTMENRTSDKYTPFMERALPVRAFGIPTNKELGLMAWGETDRREAFYSVGVFDGDGQNVSNPDNRFDAMGRVFVHPLATTVDGVLRDVQVGGSVRYGRRDRNYVNYDYQAMTTQGTYKFWSSTYTDSKGLLTHVIPAGSQLGLAGELRVPVSVVDLTGEFVYVKNDTREALDGYQATNTQRLGDLHGYSYYVQLGVWLLGNRDVNGLPGYENPPHLDFNKPDPADWPQAVQLLVKWEQLRAHYASASRAGAADGDGNVDGDINVNVFSAGINYWATKQVRVTANYLYDMFPGSDPATANVKGQASPQSPSQRATAPGNNLAPGVNDAARTGAHALHELLFRAAIAF